MPLPWMSIRDRNRWKAAQNIGQLGGLMALWLQGIIESRPGYAPRHGPDAETCGLVPSLAALCRKGYVTIGSQPGLVGTGRDGLWWEQRAAVEGVVLDPALLDRLTKAATGAGMIVRINDYRRRDGRQDEAVEVTTRDGEPVTSFGGRISRGYMALQWRGLNAGFYQQVSRGIYVTIAAPEYGPVGERLWVVLDFLSGLRSPSEDDPWAAHHSFVPTPQDL